MPDKIIHQIQVDGYCARFDGKWGRLQLGTFGSYGIEQLQFSLGDSWTDLVVYANFVTADGTTPVLVPESGLVDVPPEATAKPGMGNIVLDGTADGVRIYSVNIPYIMLNHIDLSGEAPAPTPDRWEQYVAQVQQYADSAKQSAAAAAESETNASASEQAAQSSETAAAVSEDNAAQSATQAAASATAAQQSQNAAAQSATLAGDSATAAKSSQDAAAASATAAAGSASDAAASADKAAQAAGDVGGAVSQVQEAAKAALDDIATERETALEAVQTEGGKQQSAITSSGAAALEAIGQTEQAAIGQVQQAGQAQLDKTNALVPTPTQADAGKAIVVKPDGSGYELGEVQTDAYTKAESDARYAPIEAAIRPTVSGNPATLEHSVVWALQGLNVYGKSTQDGTPSPDNPVPIVSAGDAGSITVTVSDGADQSQQLIIQTPNGLPGIPVDSGGNFTDADGHQWVCDEVDFERGVYVQQVGKVIVDGTTLSFEAPPDSLYWNLPADSAPHVVGPISPTLITHFPSGVFQFNAMYDFMFAIPDLMSAYFETADALNQFCVKENSKGNPLTVYYIYDESQETPLSAEELAAYAALRSYNGTTIVSTEAPVAGLAARYVADGAAYIDGKIQSAVTQAVAAAVSLTGGAQ